MASVRNALINLLALAVLAAGALTLFGHPSGQSEQGSVLRPLPPPFPGVARLRIMLVGADEREHDVGRSDTLMLLTVSPLNSRAVLMSVPRDLLADVPGHGHTKINAAYAYGGVKLTRQTVESTLGIPLDGYIKINLQGFVKAVDTLGGVYLDVEDVEGKGRGMNYDCPQDGLVIHLKPGPQHLNGYKAMGYVRYRKSNIPGKGCTDYERSAHQQKFLRAIIAQKLRVTKLPQLVKAGQQIFACLETTLTWREVFDLMRLIRELPPEAMKSIALPVRDVKRHNGWFAVLDDDKFAEVTTEMESFLDGAGGTESGPVIVEVLNGSGVPGVAATAAEKLKSSGYTVARVGNAAALNHKTTSVLYRGEMQEHAQKIVQILGVGTVEQDPSGPAPAGTAQIQITVGKDFHSQSN